MNKMNIENPTEQNHDPLTNIDQEF